MREYRASKGRLRRFSSEFRGEVIAAIWRRLHRPRRLSAGQRHFNLRPDRICTHGPPFKTEEPQRRFEKSKLVQSTSFDLNQDFYALCHFTKMVHVRFGSKADIRWTSHCIVN
jgi:hypothetical protein